MIDFSDKYTLATLKERRAALAGEIASLESRLHFLRQMAEYVEGTIHLFDSDLEPERKPCKPVRVGEGAELNRLILTALRAARRPLSTGEVTNAVIKALGYEPGAVKGIINRVQVSLDHLARERCIVAKENDRSTVQWELAKPGLLYDHDHDGLDLVDPKS